VKSKKTKPHATRCTLHAILAGCLLAFSPGCQPAPSVDEISSLREEKTQLTRQLEQTRTEAEQLKKQVGVLSGIGPGAGLENLYRLQEIKITRYTNLYDKDNDGKKEKLIVYIQPIDEDGDIVKATGAVDVQLWDLNKADGEALLGQWHVKPDELKKLWFATIITINYRLTFDVADKIEGGKDSLTAKVTFTDYLTGKVFTGQRVIEPR